MITQNELNQVIIKDIGIESLSPSNQDKILEKLGGNCLKRITLSILKNLPEEARPKFDALAQSGEQEKMQEFLKSQIPDLEGLIQKTIKETIKEFKEFAGIK